VLELRRQFPLGGLLDVAALARSTFYYQRRALEAVDKHEDLRAEIQAVYDRHRGRYGYRRVAVALRNQGHAANHKTVQRLMAEMQLKAKIRVKRFQWFEGQGSLIAPNLLKRDFNAGKPNEKWVTDVTEFKVAGRKLYLSPVMDLFNGEIIAYDTSELPRLGMVENMLHRAIARLAPTEKPILHSDQGWQYRMPRFRQHLERRSIVQSMSRKGNCLDNAAIESFFGTLKAEFFHINKFDSVDELRTGIEGYIRYYNEERIKLRLGTSPINFRLSMAGR
jgi:putative transposase